MLDGKLTYEKYFFIKHNINNILFTYYYIITYLY